MKKTNKKLDNKTMKTVTKGAKKAGLILGRGLVNAAAFGVGIFTTNALMGALDNAGVDSETAAVASVAGGIATGTTTKYAGDTALNSIAYNEAMKQLHADEF